MLRVAIERIFGILDEYIKWSNFIDVYKRNQAVRDYMTDRCIKDNSIDVEPACTNQNN